MPSLFWWGTKSIVKKKDKSNSKKATNGPKSITWLSLKCLPKLAKASKTFFTPSFKTSTSIHRLKATENLLIPQKNKMKKIGKMPLKALPD